MNENKKITTDWKLALFIAALFAPWALFGQPLEVNNALPITPNNLITNIFLGEGVEVLDVQFQGSAAAVGFFQNGEDEIGLGRGIVMSTGFAVSTPGQVGVDAPGGAQSSEEVIGFTPDPDMEALANTNEINDLVAYTITFIPIADTLRFRYVFASEEYPEYVCSEFNDVFGFFISGPGINGPYANNAENIALVPETNLPVTINNVNPGTVGANGDGANCIPPEGSLDFAQYYNNNNGSASRPVFDGYTDVFTAEAVVFPCSTYTIRLVACDVADELFDSGVFLEAKSFGTGSLDVETATVSLDGSVAEGCAEGSLRFSLPEPTESDYPVDYNILGTADNGVDYEFIPSGLFIPAGDSVLAIPIIAFRDGLDEGTETIIIDVQRDPCNRDTIVIPIRDNVLLEPELPPDRLICRGDSLSLDGTVDVPLPPPPTFSNDAPLTVSPYGVTLYSDIEVFGVLPPTLGPGVIRSVCIDDLQTEWADDLRIFLIAPGGQFMELVSDIGNSGDNFIGTCFTPLATPPITSLGAADQPFTGEFAPEGLWEDLYGDDSPSNGTWRLSLFDKFSADTPVLNSWSITFTPLYEVGYQWQPAAGLSCADCPNPLATPDTTATYVLTATDSYGCASFDTLAIEALPVLEAPELSCAAVTSNSITVAWPAIPEAMGYEVNVDSAGWMPANGPGQHTVGGLLLSTAVHFQVRAIGACGSLTATIECATPDCEAPSVQAVSTTDASCYGSSDGSLELSASGGQPPYQFTVDGQTNATGIFTGLPAGAYSAQAVDDSGCPASLLLTINQPDELSAIEIVDSVTCNGLANGSATLDIAGGNGPFAFDWSDGQADSVATGLAAGAYQLAVTDATGCTFSYEIEVGEPEALNITVTADSAQCGGEANGRATVAVAGGSGAYDYDFSPGVIIGTNANQAVGLSAGGYEVTVTDSKGCQAVSSFFVEEPAPLAVQLSAVDALCADSASASVSAVVSGGIGSYMYTWQDALMDTLGNSALLSNVSAGQYFLIVEDENRCALAADVAAGEPEPLAYNLDVQPASCPGVADGAANLQANGGAPAYTYQWNDIGDGPAVRSGLATGDYTVTITDANGCSLAIEIEVDSPPPVTLELTSTPPSCVGGADGQATVIPSGGAGGYTYLWADGQDAATATGLTAGPVLVVVTDENGCQAMETVVIEQALALELEVEGTLPSCFDEADGVLMAAAQGGAGNYSYLWSNGVAGPTATGLVAGAYSVTATDGNGCIASDSLVLVQPAALANTTSVTEATCNPEPDGSAIANVQGGVPPYAYSWSDGQSQAAALNLEMGGYTLTITDANGCRLTDTVEVGGIPAIRLNLEQRDVSCQGVNDGAVTALATGGAGAYSFNWSDGVSTSGLAGNLTAGVYSVTVTDSLGCAASASALIGEPPALQLATAGGLVTCAGDRDGSVSLSIGGGTPPYGILWNTGDTISVIDGLGVGAYFVTVTDANGCTASGEEQVAEGSPIDVSITIEDASCFGDADGAVSVQASGGMPPFTYAWPGGVNGPVVQNIPAGSYALSITDAAGCEVVEDLVVGQPPAPLDASINPADVSCFGATDGQLEIIASGGTPFYRYSLDGDFFSGNSTFIGLAPGTYTVHIRDVNGCTFRSAPMTVGEPAPILVDLGDTKAVPFGGMIRLRPEIDGGVGAFGYDWSPRDSSVLSCFGCSAPLATVTGQVSIKVEVTDEDGCKGADIVTVYPQKERPVLVPTGFTPNNDGNNDRLLVHARPDIEVQVMYFRVYGRWGELLFEANQFEPNDESFGWDGAFRGQPVSGGVYIWHLGVEFVDGNQEEFTGHTTLIR